MACKEHSEATELSKFIAEFGEDMPEEWELVEEEKATLMNIQTLTLKKF